MIQVGDTIQNTAIVSGSSLGVGGDLCRRISGYTRWFAVPGTGSMLTASLCNSFTSPIADTSIEIYTGDCPALSCVAFNENPPSCSNSLHSEVSWQSAAGTVYLILVRTRIAGPVVNIQIELTVTSAAPAPTNSPTALPSPAPSTMPSMAPNAHPKVEGGEPIVVFVSGSSGAPADNGQLVGVATDSDGDISQYQWTTDCPHASITNDEATPDAVISIDAGTTPTFCRATLEVTDSRGSSSSDSTEVVIVDPAAGFISGAGLIESPAGAFLDNPSLADTAGFVFSARYQRRRSAPQGSISFTLRSAHLRFRSTDYEWLVVTGDDCAKVRGNGRIDREGGYGFMLTVCDNGVPGRDNDKFRFKIWNVEDGSIVYDNMVGANDDNSSYSGQLIRNGNIRVSGGEMNQPTLRH